MKEAEKKLNLFRFAICYLIDLLTGFSILMIYVESTSDAFIFGIYSLSPITTIL